MAGWRHNCLKRWFCKSPLPHVPRGFLLRFWKGGLKRGEHAADRCGRTSSNPPLRTSATTAIPRLGKRLRSVHGIGFHVRYEHHGAVIPMPAPVAARRARRVGDRLAAALRRRLPDRASGNRFYRADGEQPDRSPGNLPKISCGSGSRSAAVSCYCLAVAGQRNGGRCRLNGIGIGSTSPGARRSGRFLSSTPGIPVLWPRPAVPGILGRAGSSIYPGSRRPRWRR
jgi:hypothetical protein